MILCIYKNYTLIESYTFATRDTKNEITELDAYEICPSKFETGINK